MATYLRIKSAAYNRKERDEGTDIPTFGKKNEIGTTILKPEVKKI